MKLFTTNVLCVGTEVHKGYTCNNYACYSPWTYGKTIVSTHTYTCKSCTTGKVACTQCNGTGTYQSSVPCLQHSELKSHYYCTSESQHGKSISRYH